MKDVAARRESGSASIRALGRNFLSLGRHGIAALLVPWLGIAAIDFGFVALGVAIALLASTADPSTAAGITIQVVGLVQAVAIMTLRVSLLATVRDVALQGSTSVGGLEAVVQSMRKRLGSSFAITVGLGLIVAVGLALCVLPGLVALFVFAFAPYLVVARDRSVIKALQESVQWARDEWLLLLSAVVVGLVVVGLWAVLAGTLSVVGMGSTARLSVGMIGGWLVNTFIGYLAFIWWGAVYVTADERRQVRHLRSSAAERPSGPTIYHS